MDASIKSINYYSSTVNKELLTLDSLLLDSQTKIKKL